MCRVSLSFSNKQCQLMQKNQHYDFAVDDTECGVCKKFDCSGKLIQRRTN